MMVGGLLWEQGLCRGSVDVGGVGRLANVRRRHASLPGGWFLVFLAWAGWVVRRWGPADWESFRVLVVSADVGQRRRVGQPSTACARLPLPAVCVVVLLVFAHARISTRRAIWAQGFPYL